MHERVREWNYYHCCFRMRGRRPFETSKRACRPSVSLHCHAGARRWGRTPQKTSTTHNNKSMYKTRQEAGNDKGNQSVPCLRRCLGPPLLSTHPTPGNHCSCRCTLLGSWICCCWSRCLALRRYRCTSAGWSTCTPPCWSRRRGSGCSPCARGSWTGARSSDPSAGSRSCWLSWRRRFLPKHRRSLCARAHAWPRSDSNSSAVGWKHNQQSSTYIIKQDGLNLRESFRLEASFEDVAGWQAVRHGVAIGWIRPADPLHRVVVPGTAQVSISIDEWIQRPRCFDVPLAVRGPGGKLDVRPEAFIIDSVVAVRGRGNAEPLRIEYGGYDEGFGVEILIHPILPVRHSDWLVDGLQRLLDLQGESHMMSKLRKQNILKKKFNVKIIPREIQV